MFSDPLSPDVIVADDHPATRFGIRFILNSYFPGARLREVGNGRQVMECCERQAADLLLLDLNMPDTHPLPVVREVLHLRPSLNILIFTVSKEEIFGPLYFNAGVKGYLSKSRGEAELVKAIETVLSGKRYIHAEMLSFYEGKERPYDPYAALTVKEREALRHLTSGTSLTEICRLMNVNLTTVSTYKGNILGKLKLNNLLELKLLVEHYTL